MIELLWNNDFLLGIGVGIAIVRALGLLARILNKPDINIEKEGG